MKVYFLLFILVLVSSCEQNSSDQKKAILREDHLIETENGLNIHVREVQPKKQSFAEPLVMIHGGGPGATSSFDLPVEKGSFAEDLANEGFKLYLVNIRGWERSTLPAYDFSDSTLVVGSYKEAIQDIESAVNWIQEKENLKKVNLFGWATGGHWASAYAIKYPGTVNKLISLNSLYGVNAPWGLRRFFASETDSMKYDKTSFFRVSESQSLTRSWTRTIPLANKEEWRDPKVEHSYRQYASSFGDDTTVMKVPGGYREESFYMSIGKKYWDAKDITVPALIIRTKLDFWSRPEDIEAIKSDMINSSQSKFLTIPGTHYVFLDKPNRGKEKLINAMVQFINTNNKR